MNQKVSCQEPGLFHQQLFDWMGTNFHPKTTTNSIIMPMVLEGKVQQGHRHVTGDHIFFFTCSAHIRMHLTAGWATRNGFFFSLKHFICSYSINPHSRGTLSNSGFREEEPLKEVTEGCIWWKRQSAANELVKGTLGHKTGFQSRDLRQITSENHMYIRSLPPQLLL